MGDEQDMWRAINSLRAKMDEQDHEIVTNVRSQLDGISQRLTKVEVLEDVCQRDRGDNKALMARMEHKLDTMHEAVTEAHGALKLTRWLLGAGIVSFVAVAGLIIKLISMMGAAP